MILDPQLRDWVLLPITLILFLVTLLKENITRLFSSPKPISLEEIRQSQLIQFSQQLLKNGKYLPIDSFEKRHTFLLQELKPEEKKAEVDPAQMSFAMEGMRKNMLNFVPQSIIMAWINYFFSGFVIVKLPFDVPMSFKSMLQRGIEADLDAEFVSSLSWYFLNLFGLRGIFALFTQNDVMEEFVPQMGMPNAKENAWNALKHADYEPVYVEFQ